MKEYRKARENVAVMAVCTALSLLVVFYIIPVLIKVPAAAKKDVFTPQTFPYFCGVIMLLCSAAGTVKAVVQFQRARAAAVEAGTIHEKPAPKTTHERITAFIPWIVYALVVLYGLGINRIGFILPTLVMIPVILTLLGCRKWQWYLYVYLFAAAMWAIFKFVLHVQLP